MITGEMSSSRRYCLCTVVTSSPAKCLLVSLADTGSGGADARRLQERRSRALGGVLERLPNRAGKVRSEIRSLLTELGRKTTCLLGPPPAARACACVRGSAAGALRWRVAVPWTACTGAGHAASRTPGEEPAASRSSQASGDDGGYQEDACLCRMGPHLPGTCL